VKGKKKRDESISIYVSFPRLESRNAVLNSQEKGGESGGGLRRSTKGTLRGRSYRKNRYFANKTGTFPSLKREAEDEEPGKESEKGVPESGTYESSTALRRRQTGQELRKGAGGRFIKGKTPSGVQQPGPSY